jgi:hypothetical protein
MQKVFISSLPQAVAYDIEMNPEHIFFFLRSKYAAKAPSLNQLALPFSWHMSGWCSAHEMKLTLFDGLLTNSMSLTTLQREKLFLQ